VLVDEIAQECEVVGGVKGRQYISRGYLHDIRKEEPQLSMSGLFSLIVHHHGVFSFFCLYHNLLTPVITPTTSIIILLP